MPLGYENEQGAFFIYNHMDMVVKLIPAPNKDNFYQVVGFEISPRSIDHELHRKEQKASHNVDIRSGVEIGQYLSHEESEHEQPQALVPMKEFSFSYSAKFVLVDDMSYEDRLLNYWLSAVDK